MTRAGEARGPGPRQAAGSPLPGADGGGRAGGAGGAGGAFADLLAGCRPLFPSSLVDAAGWRRLLDLAGTLPRCVADVPFGFEFHLAEARAEADLCVVARPGSALERHYVRAGAQAAPGSAAAALAAGFRERAGNPASYLAAAVDAWFLEYDLAGLAPRRPFPPPGIFLVPRPAPGGPLQGFPGHGDPAGLTAALAAVAGWDGCDAEVLGQVERIFAALPEEGCVHQAGALPARSPKAVRIVAAGLARDGIPALLERLAWPGPTAAAADVLALAGGLADEVFVSLDVTARGPGPRLGLELFCGPRWFEADRAAWLPLVARLEEQGWCLPAKADGLRRWPRTERLLGDGEVSHVRQGINHVKVVLERGARTAAKAYGGMLVIPYGSKLPAFPPGAGGLTPEARA